MDNSKENKKFKNVNMSTSQNRSQFFTPQATKRYPDLESVFNSAHSTIFKENDISTISSSATTTSHFNFNNELVMTAANYKSTPQTEIVASSDLLAKQTEVDTLYQQYLMITSMNETLKKNFAEDEKTMMKDALELFKAESTLKQQVFDMENEDKVLDELIDLVDFMDKINLWIDGNWKELEKFQGNYQKLAEICSKAKNYLKISNIHRPKNVDFEETVAFELNKTKQIMQQINNIFERLDLKQPPSAKGSEEKIDLKLIAELRAQNVRLRNCIVKYNGLKTIK